MKWRFWKKEEKEEKPPKPDPEIEDVDVEIQVPHWQFEYENGDTETIVGVLCDEQSGYMVRERHCPGCSFGENKFIPYETLCRPPEKVDEDEYRITGTSKREYKWDSIFKRWKKTRVWQKEYDVEVEEL